MLLQRYKPFLPPTYALALLRGLDVLILAVWGPWPLSKKYLQDSLKESALFALFLGCCGAIFLVLWRNFSGQPLFEGTRRDAAFLVTACLLAPIAEELVFRGILYRVAREWWNIAVCTMFISLIFAAVHFAFHQYPLLPFLGSVIFCLAYEKTKSILSPILVHITGNFIIYGLPLTPLWKAMLD